jgi:dTMP kinase
MREVGRLLERLEHAIGRLVVHRLGALDDEHAPARLERSPRRRRHDGLVDVGDEHLRGAAGGDPGEVGVHAVLHPRAHRFRIGGALAQQRDREGASDRRLAGAAGAVEEVGVAGPAVGRQRAVEDGARVGVTLGGGEHLWKATAMRGRLITIEGLDGTGKTTLAEALVDELRGDGGDVLLLREPGGVELSERIRAVVKDPGLEVGPRAEALLYAAARAQLVAERVEPALAAGTWVLLDRFVDSSLAYQGVGRGLGIEAVRDVNLFATGGLRPDRTLLLRADAATRAARQLVRGEAPDRLEREEGAFFDAIAGAYDALAAAEPERFRVLDAAAAPDAVLGAARAALADLG